MSSRHLARLSRAVAGSLAVVVGVAAGGAARGGGTCGVQRGGDDGALLQMTGKPGAIAEDRDKRGAPGGGEPLDIDLLKADHNTVCQTILLTTFLGKRGDPIHSGHVPANFDYLERYYRSIMALPSGRAKAVILHDFLPEDITRKYTTADGTVSFVKVESEDYDHLLGNNDLRYLLYEEEIKKHPEWDNIFMTDGQDVVVVHNPCVLVEKHPDKVFAHSQKATFKSYTWIKHRFWQMGGKYQEWHDTSDREHIQVLNAGILGGKRKNMLKALREMNKAIMDPNLHHRKVGRQVACNMAAFNYVLYNNFNGSIVTEEPLHSVFLRYENRTDVYFWHK